MVTSTIIPLLTIPVLRAKVTIICKTHGSFSQLPSSHLTGAGCPECATLNNANNKRSDTDEFITKARLVHGDIYDYSITDYVKSASKVNIICKHHGEFTQEASSHLTGIGCPKCGALKRAQTYRSDTDEFVAKARIIHGDIYDYSKVDYFYARTKVTIICKTHGPFLQTPNSHLYGTGCSKCATLINANKGRSDTNEFITKAKLKHGDRYDYSMVDYIKAASKVTIICRQRHFQFEQSPNAHLAGKGCIKCNQVGYSKVSIQWLEFMEGYYGIHIQHAGNSAQEHRIKSTMWRADGYCSETNTIYEFHGDFWHGNPRCYESEFVNNVNHKKMKTLYTNTLKREQKIKALGYNLCVIWELDWNRVLESVIAVQQSFKRHH